MFDKVWKIVVMIAVLGGVIGGIAYWASLEPKREMTPLMHELAQETVMEFREALPRERSVDEVLLIVAGRGGRDEEEQFRGMLVEAVRRNGKYRVKSWEDVEDFLEEGGLFATALEKLNLLPGQEPSSWNKSLEVIEMLGKANFDTDGLLWVDVTEFHEGPDDDGLGARVSVEAKLYSTKQKKTVGTVPAISRGIDSAWDLRYLSYRMGEVSMIWRFGGWFLVCVILPWALIGLVRGVVKKKNNQLNIALLAGLTGFDVVLGWILLTALGTGAAAIVSLLLVAALMGYYNYDATDYIERRLL